jgi:pilus assembly protein CpaE
MSDAALTSAADLPPKEPALETSEIAVAAEPSFQETRQIPRISIHGFCLSPETGVVLQRAAEDRRSTRAHVTVMMGGTETAVEHYADKPTPNLILIETQGPRDQVLDELAALAECCDPGTKVIVLGAVNDITLYRELMRRGIGEYLVGPYTPVQLIDTIYLLYGDPGIAPIGRVMAFIGAKGGVGSSTIAHNVGWGLAEAYEEETTIVDFDLPFGTTGLDFNQEQGQGLLEAVTAPERLDEMLLERLLIHATDRLSLFTAPAHLEREMELNPEICDAVLEVVRASVPCVVLDMPHAWTAWSRQVLSTADEVVITATPELASLRNAKNLFDLLKQARPNDPPPKLVLNQVGIAKRPEIPTKDFIEAMGVEPVLILPFDAQLFGTAANNGQMIGELKGDTKAAQGLHHLAAQITGRQDTAQRKAKTRNKSLFSFLGGKKAK